MFLGGGGGIGTGFGSETEGMGSAILSPTSCPGSIFAYG